MSLKRTVFFPTSAISVGVVRGSDTLFAKNVHTQRNQGKQMTSARQNHCGKADVRTIGYLQHNMAGT